MNGGGRRRLRGDSLFCLGFRLRLKAVQIICGLLRMGCGRKDRPLVVPQDFELALYVGGVIRSRFGCQAKIGTKECCAKFGNKLFPRITFIAPFLAPEFTVKPFRVLGPVGQLMRQSGIVSLGAAETLKGWHLHMVAVAASVKGPIAAMPQVCARCAEKRFGMFDPLRGVNDGLGLHIVALGQALDLLHVEHGVGLHERDFALFGRAVLLFFGLGEGVGIDNRIAALAFSSCASLSAKRIFSSLVPCPRSSSSASA